MTNSNSAKRKTCTKKRIYQTEMDANIAAMNLIDKRVFLQVYQCGFCDKFHHSSKKLSYKSTGEIKDV